MKNDRSGWSQEYGNEEENDGGFPARGQGTERHEAVDLMNWGGKLGAVLANCIVGDWFGLFGFCVPVVLVILSLRIMRFRPAMLRKSVRLTLILMILGSLTIGYLFGDSWTVFGSGLGGQQGIEVSRWLVSVLGRVGAGLLLLLSIILYAIYVNRNTISLLNRVGKEIVDNGGGPCRECGDGAGRQRGRRRIHRARCVGAERHAVLSGRADRRRRLCGGRSLGAVAASDRAEGGERSGRPHRNR